MAEFKAWPKTPRLNRDMVITEKIDGTNAAIHVHGTGHPDALGAPDEMLIVDRVDGGQYAVAAQSRKRLITPENDNFGFARWVYENASELAELLGTGVHYGEWWGSGVQRGYGLQKGEKRFSLFNVARYENVGSPQHIAMGIDTVPVLHEGPFSTSVANSVCAALGVTGSYAAPGFMDPEGVIVFHTAANSVFKVTIKDDEKPKGSAE